MDNKGHKVIKKPLLDFKDYLVSVIVPIYNTEAYLRDALDSVIKQTIGFDSIQLILVNNATEDNAGAICEEYAKQYNRNITYIKIDKNINVSYARNVGKKYAKGKFVTFLDSDDKWAEDVFELMIAFLGEHEDIDFVASRMCFFGRREGFEHPLDYKFDESCVVDIYEKPEYIQMAVNACMFRGDAVAKVDFDEAVDVSEDTLYVSRILMDKCKYGILRESVYYYQKREDESSAIDLKYRGTKWFTETPEKSYGQIIKLAKERFECVPEYFQYQIMYDLRYRLREEPELDMLSDVEKNNYVTYLKTLLEDIDDKVILTQRKMSREYKFFALKLKHGEEFDSHISSSGSNIYYDDIRIQDLNSNKIIVINELEQGPEKLSVRGTINFPFPEDCYELYFETDTGKVILPVFENERDVNIRSLGYTINTLRGFMMEASIEDVQSIRTYIKWKNEAIGRPRMKYSRWTFLKSFINNVD